MSSQPQVVVISRKKDDHLALVQKHLDIPLTHIDPLAVLDGTELSYESAGDEVVVTYDGVALTNVVGAWYRKPLLAQPRLLSERVAKGTEEYAADASQKHSKMLRGQWPDATWVSDFYAILRADNKVLQLQEAERLGFAVPKWLFTSNGEKARAFVEANEPCIVKTMSNCSIPVDEDLLAFYTRPITPDHNFAHLNVAPAIFQAAIKAKKSLRVAVVKDQVFASEMVVEATNRSDVWDWRFPQHERRGRVRACAYKLSPQTADRCIALRRRLGVLYGAIDLIVDPNDQEWFLEINPNGQWGFQDDHSVQQIGQALAHLLTSNL